METLRQLSHVVALQEAGNFHTAARNLGISQAALTQSIQKVEESYGATLFVRGPGGVAATTYGLIVAEVARSTLAKLEEVRYEVKIAQKLEVPRMAIGCDPFLSEAILAPVFADERIRASGVAFSLETGSWDTMHAKLLSRRLHLHFGFCDTSVDPRVRLEQYSLPAWQLFFRCGHPLSGKKIIGFDQIYEYPIVIPKLPRTMLLWLRKFYLKTYSGKMPRIPAYLLTSDHTIIRRIVRETDAIGPAFPWTIADEVERGVFSRAKMPAFPEMPASIATLTHARPTLGIDLIQTVLREHLRRIGSRGAWAVGGR